MEYKIDVESNLGLVHMLANQMRYLIFNPAVDYDDLVQDGVLGLIHAVKHFDPDLGFKFSSYAGRCIRGSMLQGSRTVLKEHWQARKNGISSTTISIFWGEEARTVARAGDHGKNAWWVTERIWRHQIMKRIRQLLTFRQRRVLDLLVGQGLGQAAVAKRLGMSRQLVSLDYRDGIRRVRKHLVLLEAA